MGVVSSLQLRSPYSNHREVTTQHNVLPKHRVLSHERHATHMFV